MKAREMAVGPVVALKLGGRFSQYKPETEKTVRKAEVNEDKVIEQLRGGLRQAMQLWSNEGSRMSDILLVLSDAELISELYHLFRKVNRLTERLTTTMTITAKDIERFSLATGEFQHEAGFAGASGIFLSKLISMGTGSRYTIHTGHLEVLPIYLGYGNTKDITINGNAGGGAGFAAECGILKIRGNADFYTGYEMSGGIIHIEGDGVYAGSGMRGGTILIEKDAYDHVGCGMERGTLHVKGDANWVGHYMKGGVIHVDGNGRDVGYSMEGGTIRIKGNAGEEVGKEMTGGKIHIKGNAGKNVGEGMDDGQVSDKMPEIRVGGEIESIGNVISGKIYHHGKLIVDK